jgi:alkylglycerol monooxygenase
VVMSLLDQILTDKVNYTALAVPVFFLLIGLELLYSWLAKKDYYRLDDSINELSCGIIQQIFGIFVKGAFFAGYLWLYRDFRLLEFHSYSTSVQWLSAFGLFLGIDFCYYWFHRIAHEVNAPWAAHIVHHQSEQFNLAVALRQGSLQAAFAWVFYLPLAVIGFPPAWFLAMNAFDTLYQFWIHTRVIGRLGPLEWVFNTPSHHRVHHARNAKYIDKNYAGTLIIWDRMFGSFVAEEEEPVYGIVKPLASWNPLWANFHRWVAMFHDAAASDHWVDRIKIWFMRPAWRPRNLPPNPPTPEFTRATVTIYHTKSTGSWKTYILIHFVATLTLSMLLLSRERQMTHWRMLPAAILTTWSLVNFGGIFERHKWAFASELIRLAAASAGTLLWLGAENKLAPLPVAVGVLSAMWLIANRRYFAESLASNEAAAEEILASPAATATGLQPATALVIENGPLTLQTQREDAID